MNKVSIHQSFRPIVLLLLLFSIGGNAQNTFLQVLSAPTTLTSGEQTKLTNIQQMPEVANYWHVETSNFEASLNGRLLLATLPGEAQTTFEADFPYSKEPGTFFWAGYGTDGSYFRLTKMPNEVLGNIYIASSGNYYGLISLSENQNVLVKYDKEIMEIEDDCSVVSEGETDDEVEDRFGCEENNVRVLFLFTPAVAGATPSPAAVAQQIINELNGASMASGISSSSVNFVLANTLLLPGFVENLDIHDDLDDVCDNSTAKNLRNSNYADMVILLTAGHPGSTVGTSGGNSEAKAYCVAEIFFATVGITGTHEIGHLLGANHQRCSTCNITHCDGWTNHHGFIIHDGNSTTPIRRTVMCQNGCAGARILRWSNPDSDFMGMDTGDFWNNNVKKIKKRAGKIACFRPNPPPVTGGGGAQFLVEITGDGEVCTTQQYIPYQSSVTPASNNYTYLYEVSTTGIGNYTQVSTSSSWILMNASTLPGT